MRKLFEVVAIATVFVCFQIKSFAQPNVLFEAFDSRKQLEIFQNLSAEESIHIDSSLISPEPLHVVPTVDTVEGWKHWSLVENFSFGKDRGGLTMIADINALHPYFRDKIKELMARCQKVGIELAIVETYRTHAKQNEYKGMGKKYTNSSGGKSKHQYGLAVDVVPMINGVAVWDNAQLWKKVGVAGEKLGLRWGGRWKKPYDPGHFEWTGGLTSVHLASGVLPVIPQENYPCIEEDLRILRRYWKHWEDFQEQALTTRRNHSSRGL